MQPRPISLRGVRPSHVSWLCALPLLGTLLALGARPAHAFSGTISATSPYTGSYPIQVNTGETLTITNGGSVAGRVVVNGGTLVMNDGSISAASDPIALLVYSGTVSLSGGSISGAIKGVQVLGGTVSISGGSISGPDTGVVVYNGSARISGGSISGGNLGGVDVVYGEVSIYGCGLMLSGDLLTGHLADGASINIQTGGVKASNLYNLPPTFANCPPAGTTAIATCTAGGVGANVNFSPLTATGGCAGTPTVSYDHQPGSFFPPGNTTVTATAMGGGGGSITCPFIVTVAYSWSGVLQPIHADGSSVFKAGSTVPVIFQLTGPSACITTLSATLSYSLASLGESAPINEAVSTSAADTGNQFRYDGTQYIFNWSTKGLASGAYQLQINLGDGVTHTVTVGLK